MNRWPTWPITIGLAFVLAGAVPGIGQEPRMPEPKLTVGDMWTYSVQTPGQPDRVVTTIVLGVRDTDYTVRTIDPDGRYQVASLSRGNTTVGNVGISWPLSVGQHWSGSQADRSTNPPTPLKIDAIVDAYELITVPAGTLGAFRVVIRGCVDMPEGECGSLRLWIAPQAKGVVKWEVDREQIWRELGGLSTVLVSYAVAP